MTTTEAQRKVKAKRARRPIYLTPMRLVDPTTGEEHAAFVPCHEIDRRLARERGFRVGHEYRAEIKQSRNVRFHRLAHAVGHLLVDNVEKFRDKSAHDALKQVQADSGVCCDVERFVIDLGQFGRHEVERNVPRSIAFDDMEEDEFANFFNGITAYIGEHYASVMLDDVRADYWQMVDGENNRRAA